MDPNYISYIYYVAVRCVHHSGFLSWSVLKLRISYNFEPVRADASEYLTGLNIRYPARCQVHVLALYRVIRDMLRTWRVSRNTLKDVSTRELKHECWGPCRIQCLWDLFKLNAVPRNVGSFFNALGISLQVKCNIFLNYVPSSVWINFSIFFFFFFLSCI